MSGDLIAFLAARLDEDEEIAKEARMLREVAAKRAILAAHPVRPIINGTCRTCSDSAGLSWSSLEPEFVDWPCPTLRALAAFWSDHPDYRQEWKP